MKPPALKFATLNRRTLPTLALCLTPLMTLPANASDDASTKLAAPTTTFRTTTLDKDTNTLRAPEADEHAAAASQGATSRSAASQSMLRSPNALRFQAQTIYGRDGSETKRLELGRALRFSVIHRDTDGTLHKDCLVGDAAVANHLSAAAPKRETNHE